MWTIFNSTAVLYAVQRTFCHFAVMFDGFSVGGTSWSCPTELLADDEFVKLFLETIENFQAQQFTISSFYSTQDTTACHDSRCPETQRVQMHDSSIPSSKLGLMSIWTSLNVNYRAAPRLWMRRKNRRRRERQTRSHVGRMLQ